MNPIHFQGLTCYHDCIISIVNYYGLDYSASFATLWSETDFRYDPFHEVYLTKRMLVNLEALGMRVETSACCSPKEVEKELSLCKDGEFMILAMDAFYIPWSQFYRGFHGPHYFVAQNSETEEFFCVDPTYDKKNEKITRREITLHTYELSRINNVEKMPLQTETIYEAQEIIHTHPKTKEALISKIYDCVNREKESIALLAKYVDAMIRNRYLYRFFLESRGSSYERDHLFLSQSFFLKWIAVKNGLYKAALSRSREGIINDVGKHFSDLIEEEMAMAEKMIGVIS